MTLNLEAIKARCEKATAWMLMKGKQLFISQETKKL